MQSILNGRNNCRKYRPVAAKLLPVLKSDLWARILYIWAAWGADIFGLQYLLPALLSLKQVIL
jgi:hypothetical protein